MIELDYFTADDFDSLISWITSPELTMQWSGPAFTYPLTRGQLSAYIEAANQDGAKTYAFKAVDTDSGQVVGHISLGRIDYVHKTGRIGKVMVTEQARGKKVAGRMLEQILELAFHKLGLNRVSLGVFDFNTPAIKAYEKAGFTNEGLIREVRKVKNEFWSYYEMSMLKREWEEK
ncbi:GNAT family N-acetyltransferase [Sediminibacillus halophilus]|uniref:Protein N-acetyltransferase, RimJ/RimL family n=1 Tax=Sediminibacillus halophilus TaxID=482461 RepID=A0A1G9N396_9BACI|nr:GNAT family protein [Sediminibacillus halophilus]SDL80741.1 Protein N-acetyltransferase, RimJ/RimL family [Sediminibacillus halophilus]